MRRLKIKAGVLTYSWGVDTQFFGQSQKCFSQDVDVHLWERKQ